MKRRCGYKKLTCRREMLINAFWKSYNGKRFGKAIVEKLRAWLEKKGQRVGFQDVKRWAKNKPWILDPPPGKISTSLERNLRTFRGRNSTQASEIPAPVDRPELQAIPAQDIHHLSTITEVIPCPSVPADESFIRNEQKQLMYSKAFEALRSLNSVCAEMPEIHVGLRPLESLKEIIMNSHRRFISPNHYSGVKQRQNPQQVIKIEMLKYP